MTNVEDQPVVEPAPKKNRWLLPVIILLLLIAAGVIGMMMMNKETPKKGPTKVIVKNNAPSIKKAKQVNVTDYGAVPDDGIDDTEAFEKALAVAKNEAIELIVPKGTYDTSRTIEVSDIKGLHIKGENAIIRPKNPMTNPPEFYAFRLSGTKDDLIEMEIEGLTIDGSKNPQDLFFTMKSSADFYKTPMTKGIAVTNTKDLKIHDMKYEHMYGGYAIFAQEYRNVNIHDIQLTDVGGDDITDSFGMAIYLSGHRDDAIVNIDKVVSDAKTSKRSKEYMGWIGVVYENGTIQDDKQENWMKDKNTTINVTNSEFKNYETTFHVESTYGNVYFNSDDIKTRAKNYFVAAGVNGELKERSNHITFDELPFGRNGIVHGVYYTEGMDPKNYSFDMYNSTVNNVEIDGKRSPISAVYGSNTTATFHNTTFNDVSDKLVTNGTGIFTDSVINLTSTANKDKLADFSESSQKLDVSKSVVNVAPTTSKAKDGDVPAKYFSTNKPVPQLDGEIAPADLGRKAPAVKTE